MKTDDKVSSANINPPAYMDCWPELEENMTGYWPLPLDPFMRVCDRVQKHALFSGTQRAIPRGKDEPILPVREASQRTEFDSNSK